MNAVDQDNTENDAGDNDEDDEGMLIYWLI